MEPQKKPLASSCRGYGHLGTRNSEILRASQDANAILSIIMLAVFVLGLTLLDPWSFGYEKGYTLQIATYCNGEYDDKPLELKTNRLAFFAKQSCTSGVAEVKWLPFCRPQIARVCVCMCVKGPLVKAGKGSGCQAFSCPHLDFSGHPLTFPHQWHFNPELCPESATEHAPHISF